MPEEADEWAFVRKSPCMPSRSTCEANPPHFYSLGVILFEGVSEFQRVGIFAA